MIRSIPRCVLMAALLAVYAGAPAKDGFGRLFFSVEDRLMLNEMRDDDVEPEVAAPVRGETAVAPVVDVISFDGKVERSGSGASTFWVNGRPVYTGNRTVEDIRIQSGRGTNAQTRFVLPPSDIGETDFSLKAGQKIAVQSGKVLDSYETRAAEDAESIFAADEPKPDGAAPTEGEAAPAGKDRTAPPAPGPGS